MAVYAPGSKVASIQASKSFGGARPLPSQVYCGSGGSRQLSSMIVTNPFGPCNSRIGLASELGTPDEGPIPRRSTCFGALPVMMNPPIPTLSPVKTCKRVERLSGCAGGDELAVEVGVGLLAAVAVAVAVP